MKLSLGVYQLHLNEELLILFAHQKHKFSRLFVPIVQKLVKDNRMIFDDSLKLLEVWTRRKLWF